MLGLVVAFAAFVTYLILSASIMRSINIKNKGLFLILASIINGCYFYISITKFNINQLNFYVTYFLLVASFILSFPAIDAKSPSLIIMDFIAKNQNNLKMEDLAVQFDESILIKENLKKLIEESYAVEDGDIIHLTGKGKFLASIFIYYRNILNINNSTG